MRILPILSSTAILTCLLGSGCCSYNGRPPYASHHPVHPPHASTQPVPPTYTPPPVITTLPANPPPVITPLPANPPPVITTLPAHPPGEVVGDTLEFKLKTEDFTVDKRTVPDGVVRIRKYIVTEPKSAATRVCHDEYTVVREPASGPTQMPFWEGETYVQLELTRETLIPVVTPRIYEIVHIRKSQVCETNVVTGNVRTEKIEAVRTGGR